jgi:hypothetical protein
MLGSLGISVQLLGMLLGISLPSPLQIDISSALSTIAMVDMGSTETLHNRLGCEYTAYSFDYRISELVPL